MTSTIVTTDYDTEVGDGVVTTTDHHPDPNMNVAPTTRSSLTTDQPVDVVDVLPIINPHADALPTTDQPVDALDVLPTTDQHVDAINVRSLTTDHHVRAHDSIDMDDGVYSSCDLSRIDNTHTDNDRDVSIHSEVVVGVDRAHMSTSYTMMMNGTGVSHPHVTSRPLRMAKDRTSRSPSTRVRHTKTPSTTYDRPRPRINITDPIPIPHREHHHRNSITSISVAHLHNTATDTHYGDGGSNNDADIRKHIMFIINCYQKALVSGPYLELIDQRVQMPHTIETWISSDSSVRRHSDSGTDNRGMLGTVRYFPGNEFRRIWSALIQKPMHQTVSCQTKHRCTIRLSATIHNINNDGIIFSIPIVKMQFEIANAVSLWSRITACFRNLC